MTNALFTIKGGELTEKDKRYMKDFSTNYESRIKKDIERIKKLITNHK